MKESKIAAEIPDKYLGSKIAIPGKEGLWEVFGSESQESGKPHSKINLFWNNPKTGRKEFETLPLKEFEKFLRNTTPR